MKGAGVLTLVEIGDVADGEVTGAVAVRSDGCGKGERRGERVDSDRGGEDNAGDLGEHNV